MTTHSEIISRIGPKPLASLVGMEPNSIYQWRRNDSIPAPYWKSITDAGLATVDELLTAAAQKRHPAEHLT